MYYMSVNKSPALCHGSAFNIFPDHAEMQGIQMTQINKCTSSICLPGVQCGPQHQRRDGDLPGALPLAHRHRLPLGAPPPHRLHLLPLPPLIPPENGHRAAATASHKQSQQQAPSCGRKLLPGLPAKTGVTARRQKRGTERRWQLFPVSAA